MHPSFALGRSCRYRGRAIAQLVVAILLIGAALIGIGTRKAYAVGLPCSSVGDFVDSAYWTTSGAPDYLDTLVINPSACGRLILGGSGQTSMALTEALQLAGQRTPPNVDGLLDQLQCHTLFAPSKPVWDLEPARPHVGLAGTIAASCNPRNSQDLWINFPPDHAAAS